MRALGARGDEETPQAIRLRVLLIIALGVVAAGAMLVLPPIPQDPAYHHFADRRSLLGIPNLLNVLSNAPFLLVAALGSAFLRRKEALRAGGPLTEPWERQAFGILFAGVALTGFGSAYTTWRRTTPPSSGIGSR